MQNNVFNSFLKSVLKQHVIMKLDGIINTQNMVFEVVLHFIGDNSKYGNVISLSTILFFIFKRLYTSLETDVFFFIY
jgi:hypothetical protein